MIRRYGALILAAAISLASGTASAELEVGDRAPSFALPGSDGAMHTLEEYVGKQAVVLAWFPKAFTPG